MEHLKETGRNIHGRWDAWATTDGRPVIKFLHKYVPITEWLPNYPWKEYFFDDFVAGLTVGVTLISQGLSYGALANLPPLSGLYVSVITNFLYPFFGTSRHVNVGPTAVVSLLTAEATGAATTTEDRVSIAISLAFIVGIFSMILGLLKLGATLQNALSRPAVSGFTSASAFVIVASQLKSITSQKVPKSQIISDNVKYIFDPQYASTFSWQSTVLGIICFILLHGIRMYNAKTRRTVPGTLIVSGLVILIIYARRWDLTANIPIIGSVPPGLPPSVSPKFDVLSAGELIKSGIVISLVGLVETMAVGSKIAFINNYEIEGDQEIFALGVSNFFASFAYGYPSCGSFSRTAEMHTLGARTQMASFIVGFVIMFALLFLAPLFYYLPNATLGAVVITSVISLIDISEAKRLFKYHWRDLFTHIMAFTVTFGWGLEWGVVAALAASVVNVLLVVVKPNVRQLGRDGDHFEPLTVPQNKYEKWIEKLGWSNRVALSEEPVPPAGGIIFRVEAPLYFLNVSHTFSKLHKMQKLHKAKGEALEWVIFDMKNVTDVDATAIEGLINQILYHKLNGIWFVLADMNLHVKQQLIDAEVIPKHIPEKIIFRTVEAALRRRLELNKAPSSDYDVGFDIKNEVDPIKIEADPNEKILTKGRRESHSDILPSTDPTPIDTPKEEMEMTALKVVDAPVVLNQPENEENQPENGSPV